MWTKNSPELRRASALALILIAMLTGIPVATAAICSRIKTFDDGEILTAADLNSEFGNGYDCVNGISDANIASSASISASKLNASIAGAGIARDSSTGVLSVGVDDSTIEEAGDAIRVKDAGITSAKLAAAVAGDGLAGGAGTALSVTVGDGLEIAADTVKAKVSDLAGDGIESDGSNNLRIKASVAGDGLAHASGVLSVGVDDSTIEISSDALQLKDAGVGWGKLAARAAGGTLSAGQYGTTLSSGTFSTTNTTYTDVTNLSGTVTISGIRPVLLWLTYDGSTPTQVAATTQPGFLAFDRDGTTLSELPVYTSQGYPLSSFWFIDLPGSAGSVTYKLQAKVTSGGTIAVTNAKMRIMEL